MIAAGGSINEAISLSLKMASGQLTREPIGVKLFYLYSINMRNDPAKKISAVSIYLKKGLDSRTIDFANLLKRK